jgi:hypothetical protein
LNIKGPPPTCCWNIAGGGVALVMHLQLKTAINPKKEKKRKSVGLEFINSLSLASKTFREKFAK